MCVCVCVYMYIGTHTTSFVDRFTVTCTFFEQNLNISYHKHFPRNDDQIALVEAKIFEDHFSHFHFL